MPSLYDLLPPDVKAAHPPESLDAPAAKVLLDPALVPAGYDAARAAAAGQTLAGLLPHMSQMRAATARVRAGQRGDLGSAGFPLGPPAPPEPAPETATQRLYRAIRDVPTMTTSGAGVDQDVTIPAGAVRAGARVVAGAIQSAPKLAPGYSTRDLVPRATSVSEHAADVLGQVLGFGATATAATAIPGVGPAAAAGLAGASTEGSAKERLIRGATMAATAGVAGKAGGALSRVGLPQGAPAWVAPTATGQLAAQVPPAVGFGAAQPLAEAVMHRLTGEKDYPLPTPQDWARGAGEMLVVNLLSHGAGAMAEQLAAAPPDVARHAQEVAKALAPPRSLTPLDAAASARLTAQVGGALKGKRIFLSVPEGGKAAAKVLDVAAFHDPASGGERIHLIVSEPEGGVPVPVTFRSLPELVRAVQPYDRAQAPRLPAGEVEQAIAPREAGRQAEAAQRTAAATATLEPTRTAREAEAAGVAARTRIDEIDRSLAGLQKSVPGKGDKEYRRWAQRVDRLTAERETLRPVAAATPRPADAAQTESPRTALPVETPKATAPTEVAEPVGGGPEAARTAPEPAQGTAAPASPAEPTAPLEQGRLPGMPTPKIPGGAKRSGFDESADIVKGMGAEPEPDRQTDIFKQPAAEAPAGPNSVSPDSRFAGGERVRVPNYTNRKNDKRPTVTGEVIGHEIVKGEPHVIVRVPRGSSESVHTLPERVVKKLPTNATRQAAAEVRKTKAARLRASVEEAIGGDPAKAEQMILDARDRQRAIFEKYGDDVTDTSHPDYAKALRAHRAAEAIADHAQHVLNNLDDARFDPDNLPPGEEEVIHYSQAPGGRAVEAAPRPKREGLLPPLPPVKNMPTTKAQRAALPAAEIPAGPLAEENVGRALAALRSVVGHVGTMAREVTAWVNPAHLVSREAKDILFRAKGDVDREEWRASRNDEHAERMFDRLTPEQRMDFFDRIEHGVAMHPDLHDIGVQVQRRMQQAYDAIAEIKSGLPQIENYFPHLWKNPEKAAVMFARRPLEGSKSFLKERVIPDIRAGLAKKLELVSDNPIKIVQGYEHNVRKFLMLHHTIKAEGSPLREAGLAIKGTLANKPGDGTIPDDFAMPDQRWAQEWLNPNTELKEYVDGMMYDGLQSIAKAIGAKTTRRLAIGGGNLGLSKARPGEAGEVLTRNFTGIDTLAHEIGHAIDSKYGMERVFKKLSTTYQNEMRALADLRNEYGGQHSKTYLHKWSEKMAVMLQAYAYIPERFREVAPNVYDKFVQFVSAHPETRPILDLQRSLSHKEITAVVSAGGPVMGSRWWLQKDLVRLLDNYMSHDAIAASPVGRSLMASRNFLNSVQLGISAFHAANLTFISSVHQFSVGMLNVADGRWKLGGAQMLKGLAPGLSAADYLRVGARMYAPTDGSGDPALAQLEHDLFTGGARLKRLENERSSFDKAFKMTIRKEWRREMQRTHGAAALHAPLAIVEATTRGIMAGAERVKVGAFRDLLAWRLLHHAEAIRRGSTTREEQARLALRDVDDRFGMMNYDNLFWNNNLKTAVMLAVRAPGWTLGTYKELGGAALVDLPKQLYRLARFKNANWQVPGESRPEVTPRMAYTLSLIALSLGFGAAYHYLHTGKRPETLEDMLHPENGAADQHGRPLRVTFPTDLRTAESIYRAARAIYKGSPDALDRVQRAVLTGPLPNAGLEFLKNQSYRGPIRKPDAPALENAGRVMQWMFGTLTPISVSSAGEAAKGSVERKAESFLGVTPYHAPSDHTRAHGRHRRAS